MNAQRREALLKEYSEVCTTFRTLTDIRFRLLAILPIAAAATAAWKGGESRFGPEGLALSALGLAATLGLIIYNARNDQLYDALVGRAGFIERSLGLPDGMFAGRPRAWLTISLFGLRWPINHGQGIGFIYGASVWLWLGSVLASLLAEVSQRISPNLPAGLIHLIAFVVAFAIVLDVGSRIRRHQKDHSKKMGVHAARATKLAHDLLTSKPGWHQAKTLCDEAPENAKLLKECTRLILGKSETRKTMKGALTTIKSRACYLRKMSESSTSPYFFAESTHQIAAQYVAFLTELPSRWILDRAVYAQVNSAARYRNAPSTGSATPEMKAAPSESRNSTAAATSSPVPGLPPG